MKNFDFNKLWSLFESGNNSQSQSMNHFGAMLAILCQLLPLEKSFFNVLHSILAKLCIKMKGMLLRQKIPKPCCNQMGNTLYFFNGFFFP